jgi:hypothetical protein
MESLSKSKRYNPEPKEGFTEIGYHVYNLNLQIDEKEIATLNELANKYKTNPIFNQEIQNENEGKTTVFLNDNKRRTSNPIQNKRDPVIKETMRVVNQFTKLINPKFKVQKAVYLRSEAGCLPQAEHTDGTPTTNDFCSCVLAIEDGTKIRMNGRIIYLKVGEAIFFHSGVLHNGCDYDKDNNRLFFYIAKKKNDIPKDGVGDRAPIYCDYCREIVYFDIDYEHNEVDQNEYDLKEKKVKKQKRWKIENHNRKCKMQHPPEELEQNRERERLAKQKSRAAEKKQKTLLIDKVVDDDDDDDDENKKMMMEMDENDNNLKD